MRKKKKELKRLADMATQHVKMQRKTFALKATTSTIPPLLVLYSYPNLFCGD